MDQGSLTPHSCDGLSPSFSFFGLGFWFFGFVSRQVEVEPEDVSDLAGRLQQMGVRLDLVKLYCPGRPRLPPCCSGEGVLRSAS